MDDGTCGAAGFILLIHPGKGSVWTIGRGDPNPKGTFADLVLSGYEPVGPRAREVAERIRVDRSAS